ncbi:MAG: helix-turn-helix transcriptional regulator [Planctomycetales bacterium]|nr:helix-turn-helix transcriptional regulator [Planctomycetales bacterium]
MDPLDLVFQALAHPIRRAILDLLKRRPGLCINDIAEQFDVSRIAVLKHLRVLEECQLIIVKKSGRKRAVFFNVVPIQAIYDRWTTEYSAFWAEQALDLKAQLEASIHGPGPDKQIQKSSS